MNLIQCQHLQTSNPTSEMLSNPKLFNVDMPFNKFSTLEPLGFLDFQIQDIQPATSDVVFPLCMLCIPLVNKETALTYSRAGQKQS